jgi:SAM-dependent methyltransferase
MAIFRSTGFKESALAHQLLDGLKGLEVGGAAHNAFGLDVVNVDKFATDDPRFAPYAEAQKKHGNGRDIMPVDIIAPGDKIPVPDKSFDFVISSHVIEHFFDPIKALKEWARIARKYIYIICPHKWALESDKTKLLTGYPELVARHKGEIPAKDTDEHHSRWDCQTFMEMCANLGFHVSHWQEVDDKVGNGFAVVIDLQPLAISADKAMQEIMVAAWKQGGLKIEDSQEKLKTALSDDLFKKIEKKIKIPKAP